MKKFSVWFPSVIGIGILVWGVYWVKNSPETSLITALGAVAGIIICAVVAIMNYGK